MIGFARSTLVLLAAGATVAATPARLSDPIGIYGIIDKVVLLPDASSPTTIQVWGVFALSENVGGDRYKPVQRGYLYFTMDPARSRQLRAEWADLKSLAGTGTAIGFGAKYTRTPPRLRCPTELPANPDVYTTNIGIAKSLSDPPNTMAAELRRQLENKKRSNGTVLARQMNAGVLRHSSRDSLLVMLAGAHGALLLTAPSAPLIAIGIWWNANTIAHNFIHLPFFRSLRSNAIFSGYLSLLLGVPQTLWRDRHLAHHAGRAWRFRWSARMAAEIVVVTALWAIIATRGHETFLMWTTGWLGGMLLCQLQGHFEHARGTTSHYGTPYNLLFFNDGYHIEHHAHPAAHWSVLPRYADPAAPRSRWPAVLRWLDSHPLDVCERLVLRSPRLQRFVLRRHERAFRRLLAGLDKLPPIQHITIVGGGIFPRSALVLRRLLPAAEITIVDRSADNLRSADEFLGRDVRVLSAEYSPAHGHDSDLLVVPLAFQGDRSQFYDSPPSHAVAVHDWLWRPHGAASTVVSLLLLKRLNLVVR